MEPLRLVRSIWGTLAITLLTLGPAHAAGLLTPRGGSLPPLAIRDHTVRVTINNGFAVTEVDQTFHNPHERDLDALYTFPLPKNAALSELSIWIDGVETVGEVVEKERARAIVKQEQEAGRETALAEKRDYLAFDILVSPVRAGKDTRVRILYLQPLEIDSGMGRYVYPLEEGNVDEEAQQFWERRPEVHGKFSFAAEVASAYPIDEVRVPGYEGRAVVTRSASDRWDIHIDEAEGTASLIRDVVLYYRLAENLPARVDLLAHREGDDPGTFLIVITPGGDLAKIDEGVDWSVVLDVSGSMDSKIRQASSAVERALGTMRPQDRFRIVTFANSARFLMQEWTPATPESVQEAQTKLRALSIEGGTNLYEGFELGLSDLEADRTSALILVSDGGANVGPTEHGDFLKLLADKDVRVFTFVIGQGANQPLLGRLAEESGGFSMDVANQDDLYGRLLQAKAKLGREALHGVRVELDGGKTADLAPERLPTAYWGQQIGLFGRYTEPGPTSLRLHAKISGEDRTWQTRIELPEHDTTYPELERLWALARVRTLQGRIADGGEQEALRAAVVALGTQYSIVTDYTSMVVVRDESFDELGIDRTNRRRVERERLAREQRAVVQATPTSADRAQPMFGGAPAHGLGGGAAGPAVAGLLLALLGARAWLVWRRNAA